MPTGDVPSSPPGPSSSLEESLKYYKSQYELLESELADFQSSSKELEAELEKDIEASEKRERALKDRASNLQYEVDEWKAKYKQAKSEASAAQAVLQREVTELREANRGLQLKLRDIEVANDEHERKQRSTESSLEDMESKYSQAIERSVMLEDEVRAGEAERESLRIAAQRLKDELSDLTIEAEIVREKLKKAEAQAASPLIITPVPATASPRSELSPTTTDASFSTPPAKTSSSGVSDTPTPPSPPISDQSGPANVAVPKPSATPTLANKRTNLTVTPRQPTASFSRVPSIPAAISRTAAASSAPRIPRTSLSAANGSSHRSTPAGMSQSASIMHLRSLRSKLTNLEERVQSVRSKLPAPINSPPQASPRGGSAIGQHGISDSTAMPSSVTPRDPKHIQDPTEPIKFDGSIPTPGVAHQSSLSNHGYDGTMEEELDGSTIDGSIVEDDENMGNAGRRRESVYATPTARRTTLARSRLSSDFGAPSAGSAANTPNAGKTRIPGLGSARRPSQGVVAGASDGLMRPPSRTLATRDADDMF
ncbi:hypothetical protein DV735_g2335, partial [Chaetothyriales sp. CBS 134920]